MAALKSGKGAVQSEYLDEATAKAELERINAELNDVGGPEFVRLGESATVRRTEVAYVYLTEPPTFGVWPLATMTWGRPYWRQGRVFPRSPGTRRVQPSRRFAYAHARSLSSGLLEFSYGVIRRHA